ncbi:MAG: HEAT repeat domain-containing protein [Planctomycetes bacterium]|nr:HEAT repeat domain-containing protein [Planctomycetota bacterium]
MLRWRALQAIRASGPAASSTRALLERILVRPGRDLRLEAARALGAIGDRRAIPALEARLSESREGHDVLLEVERSLLKLKGKSGPKQETPPKPTPPKPAPPKPTPPK